MVATSDICSLTTTDGTRTAVFVNPIWDFLVHCLPSADQWTRGCGLGPALIHHGRTAGGSIEWILQISNCKRCEKKADKLSLNAKIFQVIIIPHCSVHRHACNKILGSTSVCNFFCTKFMNVEFFNAKYMYFMQNFMVQNIFM